MSYQPPNGPVYSNYQTSFPQYTPQVVEYQTYQQPQPTTYDPAMFSNYQNLTPSYSTTISNGTPSYTTTSTSLPPMTSYSTTASTVSPSYTLSVPSQPTIQRNSANILSASTILPVAPEGSRTISLSLPDLQLKFVLACAEVDRLVVAKSLAVREAEYWREKFLTNEREGKSPGNDVELISLRSKATELEGRCMLYTQEIQNLKASLETSKNQYLQTGLKDAIIMERDKEIQNLKSMLDGNKNSTGLLVEKDRELETLRQKINSMEGLYLGQIAELKKQQNGNSKTRLDAELNKLKEDHSNQTANLIAENQRINEMLHDKLAEIDSWKQRSSSSSEKDTQIVTLKEKMRQLESDLQNQRNRNNDNEVQNKNLQAEITKMSAKPKQTNILDPALLNEQLKLAEQRIGELSIDLMGLPALKKDKESLEAKVKLIDFRNNELEIKVRTLQDELNRLSGVAKQRDQLVDQVQTVTQRLKDFEQRNDDLNTEVKRLQELLKDRSATMDGDLKSLQIKVRDLEMKNNTLNIEVQRLSQLLASKADLEVSYDRIQVKLNDRETELAKLRDELENRTREANEKVQQMKVQLEIAFKDLLERERKSASSEVTKLIEDIKELENKLGLVLDEGKRYKTRAEQLENELRILQAEAEQLPTLVQAIESWKNKYEMLGKSQSLEIDELKQKFEKFLTDRIEKDRTAYDLRIKTMQTEYEAKIEKLVAENQRLANEYDSIKMKLPRIRDEIKADIEKILKLEYDAQVRDLQSKLDNEKSEHERLVRKLNSHVSEIEGKVKNLANEIDRLKTLLLEKENELSKYSKAETELAQLSFHLKVWQERAERAEDRNAVYAADIKRLNETINLKDLEIQELKKSIVDTENEAQSYIDATLDDIKKQLKKRMEIEREKFDEELLREKGDKDAQYKNMKYKISEYEIRINNLINDNEKLSQTLNAANAATEAERTKYANLKKQSETDLNDLRNQMEGLRRKIEQELSDKYKQKLTELDDIIVKLRTKVQDHEMRQILYFIEIERIYLINHEFQEQLDSYKTDFLALTKSYTQLELKYKSDIPRLERTILEQNEKQLDLQTTTQSLVAENSRLSDLSIQRLREIDGVRVKYSTAPDQDANIIAQVESYRRQASEVKDQLIKIESEKRNMELQVTRLTQVVESTKTENQKLYDMLNQRKLEYDNLAKESEQAKLSLSSIRALETQLRLKGEQYSEACKEIDNIAKTRDLYKNELEKLTRQDKERLTDIIAKDSVRYSQTTGAYAYPR